jgi:intergrase/recombinase
LNPRRPAPEDLKSGLVIDYHASKIQFLDWMRQIRNLSANTIEQRVHYLDKFAKPIDAPSTVMEIFKGLNLSQKRHLANGFRSLFRYYEAQGLVSKERLDILRANLPKVKSGIDINVPVESEICDSLKHLSTMDKEKRVFALYNLLLDSGLRLVEGIDFFNNLSAGKIALEKHEGFCVATLAQFRGTKLAYYGFISDYTLDLIKQCTSPMKYKKTMGGIGKHLGVISYKYLRKFAFDTMTSEALNIPESVGDFIEGRTPKTIGARHYMQLRRKALQFYPRYLTYITSLRDIALGIRVECSLVLSEVT